MKSTIPRRRDAVKVRHTFDGTTVFRYSNRQLWPIIAWVTAPCYTSIVTVGFSSEKGKPPAVSGHLRECIFERKIVMRNDIKIGAVSSRSTHSSFICGTPALDIQSQTLNKALLVIRVQHGMLPRNRPNVLRTQGFHSAPVKNIV